MANRKFLLIKPLGQIIEALNESDLVKSFDGGRPTWSELLSDKNEFSTATKFCRNSLWPVLHSMVDYSKYDAHDWAAFKMSNEMLARDILERIKDHSILAKGHHFILLADHIDLPKCTKVLILDTPFPSWNMWMTLPWQGEILAAMLKFDKIVFNSVDFAVNFMECCQKSLGYAINTNEMTMYINGDYLCKVLVHPIGINFDHWSILANFIREPFEVTDKKMILSIDRLDFTSGIQLKLQAIDDFLTIHPELRKKVVFVMVTKKPTYHDGVLEEQLETTIGRINGKFSKADWTPIHFINRDLDDSVMANLYRDAHVALITPLRSGNHRQAQEFIASQVKNPGVLVLSKFADVDPSFDYFFNAVPVNPYTPSDISKAIKEALGLDEESRIGRMEHLRRHEKARDLEATVIDLLNKVF
jgi:trehalose 6-phosphate synthase/phosphatase